MNSLIFSTTLLAWRGLYYVTSYVNCTRVHLQNYTPEAGREYIYVETLRGNYPTISQNVITMSRKIAQDILIVLQL